MHTLNDKLALAKSPIEGTGVFAIEPIEKYERLGLAHVRKPQGGYNTTQLGKFHNHSINPTCVNILDGDKRWLVAIRFIAPGEEVTVDYRLQPDLQQPEESWHESSY